MRKRLTIAALLIASTSSAWAADYYFPSNVQPRQGDIVTTATGQRYEVTGACTDYPVGSGTLSTSQVFSLGAIPCYEMVSVDGNTASFRGQGYFYNATTCNYNEYFTCPASPSTAQDVPLDLGKVVSFLLGGLTGIGFVMASAIRF